MVNSEKLIIIILEWSLIIPRLWMLITALLQLYTVASWQTVIEYFMILKTVSSAALWHRKRFFKAAEKMEVGRIWGFPSHWPGPFFFPFEEVFVRRRHDEYTNPRLGNSTTLWTQEICYLFDTYSKYRWNINTFGMSLF